MQKVFSIHLSFLNMFDGWSKEMYNTIWFGSKYISENT